MAQSRRPLRVLALHGFRMSAGTLEDLLHDVKAALSTEAEWVFVDAPNAATGEPLMQRPSWTGPFYEWWSSVDQPDGSARYLGFEESVRFLERTIAQHDPFDVLMGFSQGAMMLGVLCAMLESGRLHLADDKRWRRAVLLNAGMPPTRDPAVKSVFSAPLRVPSLHVFGGEEDPMYAGQRAMAELWADGARTVLEHHEGHSAPSAHKSSEVIASLRAHLLSAVESGPPT